MLFVSQTTSDISPILLFGLLLVAAYFHYKRYLRFVVAVDADVVAAGAAACVVGPAVAVDALFDPGRPPAKAAPPADNAVPATKDIHNRRILMTP